MALSVTSICNMALGRIGAKQITDFDESERPEAIQCRIHYEQTRDALIRSHSWRFASARVSLVADAEDPDFEWDTQFILPNDFMQMKTIYADNNTLDKGYTGPYALEGQRLLINETAVDIRYVKQVDDPTLFDSLFVELLVLRLALKLVMPLSQDRMLYREVQIEAERTELRVRTLDSQETNTTGRRNTWINARVAVSPWTSS